MSSNKQYNIEDTILLIPKDIDIPKSLAHFQRDFYNIQHKHIHLGTYPDNKTLLIYAPSFIGIWVLYIKNWKITPKIKVMIDDTSILNTYSHAFLKYYLMYEKFRLGSDVPSPFISRHLQHAGYYKILKDITIGEWLFCLRTPRLNNDHYIIM